MSGISNLHFFDEDDDEDDFKDLLKPRPERAQKTVTLNATTVQSNETSKFPSFLGLSF